MRLLLALLALLAVPVTAQPVRVPLWPPGAPGADAATAPPAVTAYLPDAAVATGAAVVFPGGGYGHLAVEKEGTWAAEWLASLGVAAFVVEYRLGPEHRHPEPLDDARRAVRTVRSRAAEWGVDPGRVAVVGFSAGGHLAATAALHADNGDPASADPVERQPAQPDLMLLAYPVVTLRDPWAHRGSRGNLLGPDPDAALVWSLSAETQVTPAAPPTFLVASTDDASVPVENALMLYDALRRAGVPAELHLFETARHGFGPRPADPAVALWTTLAEGWLRRHGWLDTP